jgi:carbon monoxide dehydrogenase subunit G
MQIISEKAVVTAPIQQVFDFLKVPSNIELLLPKDKISDFKSSDLECSFKAQGGVPISLVFGNHTEPTKLNMASGEKAPFKYTLAIILEEKGPETQGHIEFNADINMFMKMMVEKPLFSLFNSMTERLKQQF